MEIHVRRAQPLTHPNGKPFYCQVDGQNIGYRNQMFFKTKREAQAAGRRYVMAVLNTEKQNDI